MRRPSRKHRHCADPERVLRRDGRSSERRRKSACVRGDPVAGSLCGFVGLVVDGSLMMADYRNLQQVSDAAATAAAMSLYNGATAADATTAGRTTCVKTWNGLRKRERRRQHSSVDRSACRQLELCRGLAQPDSRRRTSSRSWGASSQQTVQRPLGRRRIKRRRRARRSWCSKPIRRAITLNLAPLRVAVGHAAAARTGRPRSSGAGSIQRQRRGPRQQPMGRRRSKWQPGRQRVRAAVWRLLHAADFVDESGGPQHSGRRRRRQSENYYGNYVVGPGKPAASATPFPSLIRTRVVPRRRSAPTASMSSPRPSGGVNVTAIPFVSAAHGA